MRKIFGTTILWFANLVFLYAQDIEKTLAAYTANYPNEKIYIHFDKESYVPGQTIWFKAYLLNKGMPAGSSSNFHVRLTNDKGLVVENKKYPVNGATVTGHFDLPVNLPDGDYTLQAATPNIFAQQPAPIYNRTVSISKARKIEVKKSTSLMNITFHPESGSLVGEVLTVIAFKAIDSSGNGVDASGNIISSAGAKMPFKTYFDGRGKVQFRPKAGQTYHAEVVVNGRTLKFPLPEVKAAGINLRIRDEPKGKQFLLSRFEKGGTEFDEVTLVAQIDNKVVYNNTISFADNPSVIGHLITDDIPSGVLQFTVFNKKNQPIAERLTFINNREYLSPAQIDVEAGDTANEYNLKLSFPDTVQRSLSLSVSEWDGANSNTHPQIITHFLLSSNIIATPKDPSIYFTLNNDSSATALDNLMLTSSLKNFNWNDILSATPTQNKKLYPHYIVFSGQVQDGKENTPVTTGMLNLYVQDEDSTMKNYTIPVTPSGSFKVDSMVFYGTNKFYYAYTNNTGKKREVKIKLDEAKDTFNFAAATKIELEKEVEAKTLSEVVVQSKAERASEIVNKTYSSGLFRNAGRIVIDNITSPYADGTISAFRYAQANIRTIKLQGNKFVNVKNFSFQSSITHKMEYWEVGVLVDEVPSTVDFISTLNMRDVALIKFYEAGFPGVSSSTSPGGALVIYTKKAEGRKEPKITAPASTAANDFFLFNGYAPLKQFVPQEQAIPNTEVSRIILWNPALYTSKEASSHVIPFTKNANGKKVKVVVQGFDSNGRFIFFEKVM